SARAERERSPARSAPSAAAEPVPVPRLPLLDLLAGPLGHADALAAVPLDADASGLARLGVDQHHVRDVDRALHLDDAADLLGALGVAQGARLDVALDDVHALDVDALVLRIHALHAARPAAVLAGDDAHRVVTANSERHVQSTSGESETIFMKLRSRSSRATGPKMRVPRGLLPSSMSTAAFSSKEIDVAASRPNSLRVRTTTALTTSPLRTVP